MWGPPGCGKTSLAYVISKTTKYKFIELNATSSGVGDIKKIGEDIKVSMRNIRRDANDFIKKLEKNNEATEDDVKLFEKDVQKMLDDYVKKVEDQIESKTKEIMTL